MLNFNQKIFKFIAISILSLITTIISAQDCNTGPITFATQADIDAFATNYPSCTLIDDPICIGDCTPPYTPSNITNLNGLSQLTTLWSSVDIANNPNLTNLNGLHNVTESGPLHIDNNDGLIDLTGLNSVTSVSQLNVNNCAAITSLSGLTSLTNLGSGLQVLSNPSLTSLDGLENVTNGSLNLNSCNQLSDISALSNLATCGQLNIFNCALLTDVSDLSNLTNVYSLTLSSSGLLDLTGLHNLSTIDTKLEIHNCDALNNLDDLSTLTSIGSYLKISFNDNLSDISGLENIDPASISSGLGAIDDLEIYNNTSLSDCSITSICGALIDEGATADIHDNLVDCNSSAEIIALCATPLSCTNITDPVDASVQVPIDTDLTWISIPEATGYKITVGTSTNSNDILDNLDVGLVTTYDLPSNLPYNTEIFVTIIPYDTNGDASGCGEESFTTSLDCSVIYRPQFGAPDIPLDEDVFWFASPGATGYKLVMGTTTGGTDLLNNVDVGNVLQYDPGDYPPSTTIYVTLIPYNSDGDALSCTEINFSTESAGGLGCTNLVSPSDGAINVAINTSITWQAVTGATGFKINLGTSTGGTDLANAVDVGTNLNYNHPSALPYNSDIFVSIIPYDINGDATGCQEESFSTTISCTSISAPSPNSIGANINTNITWNSVADATGYRVSISTNPLTNDIVDNEDVGLVTTYDPAIDLPYGTSIFVLVIPYFSDGDAQNCNDQAFSTEPAPGPCQVTNTNDSGDGSLRNAILCAEANAGADIIDFDISGSGPHSILLLSKLPTINDDSTTIDGTTQTGNFPMQGQIIIDATDISESSKVAMIISGAHSSILGLSFENHDLIGTSTAIFYSFGSDNFVIGAKYKGNSFVEDKWTSSIFLKENINNGVIQSNVFKSTTLGLKNGITVNSGTNNILIGGDSIWMTNEFHDFSHKAVELRNYSNNNKIINNHFKGNGTAIKNDGNFLGGVNIDNDYLGNTFLCNTVAIEHSINTNDNIQPPNIVLSKINYITGTGLPGAIVEIYATPDSCTTGECQGQMIVGRDTCDSNGDFMLLLDDIVLEVDDKVTALQTDPNKGTSDFSACAIVDEDCVDYVYTYGDFIVGSLRDAVECAVTDDEIIFLDHLSGDSIIIQDQIIIDKDLTISGLGNPATLLIGDAFGELFLIDENINVTIQDLRICNPEDAADPVIYNLGILTLSNLTIVNKSSDPSTPAIHNESLGSIIGQNLVEILKE